ncbi:MAG: hypothetical protein WC461_00495 [Candidatus Paceibacterota bacterium]
MLKKLKSAFWNLRGSILPLALKSVGLGILLFFALATGEWFYIAAFVLAGCYFYFFPGVNSRQFLASFLVILLFPAFLREFLDSGWFLAVSLAYTAIFFVLLGLKNLIFINRRPIYHFLNGVLVLAIFSLFFWSDRSGILFFVKYLAAFSAFLYLFKEFLDISNEIPGAQKNNLFAWSVSFLVFQIVWALSFLPINFLNAGALTLLIILIFQDFILGHINGSINRRLVLRNITVFIALALAIFGASSWSL